LKNYQKVKQIAKNIHKNKGQ